MGKAEEEALRRKVEEEWRDMVVPTIVICFMQALGVYGLLCGLLGFEPFITGTLVPQWTLWYAFATYWICGCSITGGYHRLFSHRSYQASNFLKVWLLCWGAGALQGSALRWAWTHRVHHRHADRDADPHDRRRGFWHSHMGWIFHKRDAFFEAARKEEINDLCSDPLVLWQHRHWLPIGLFMCYGLPSIIGAVRGEALNAFLVAGCARHFIVWHCTMLVNSAAHAPTGSKPYGSAGLAVQSSVASILAWGEGWHDWHHLYPYDSTAAEKHWLIQFNPTSVFLDLCELVGLVHSRKRALRAWQRRCDKRSMRE